jgi:hypothetical protein
MKGYDIAMIVFYSLDVLASITLAILDKKARIAWIFNFFASINLIILHIKP